MGIRLIRGIVVVLVLGSITAVGAFADVYHVGNFTLKDNSGIVPNRLPRHEQAPVTAHLRDWFSTADGTHIPAFESASGDFDKTIQLNAKGLPVCTLGQLTARSTAAAKRACPEALVGSGTGEVEVEFPEQAPFEATGPILFFNGGTHGHTTLLLVHTYVNVPAPTAIVVKVQLTDIHRGRFGLHAAFQVPRIAGGYGSVKTFKVEIGRKFTYKGQKESYLTASCPTGTYYAETQVHFAGNIVVHVHAVLPCTPKD
jgi:hypothetical protein